MKRFDLPDYKGGSIVNLMSSIAKSFGVRSFYPVLKILPQNKINSKNIVLLVIDGLGYNYLKKRGSILNDFLVGKMTSTFLPSTACAVGAFLTGVAPQQHAFPGWYVFFKEIGVFSASLRFSPRIGGQQFGKQGFFIKDFFPERSFQSKLKGKAQRFTVNPIDFRTSEFNKELSKGSRSLYYQTIDGMFRRIKESLRGRKRKYIYSYWGELDAIAHEEGIRSRKVLSHFRILDKKLKKFINEIRGTDTTLIITSDHGFVDTPANRHIRIEDYPKINECLTLPLCGDSRTAYCYVHPSKAKQFEGHVKRELSKYVWMFKSEELVKRNYYGLGKPNPKLLERIGDYVLICKSNYAFDSRLDLGRKMGKGHHGGVSKEEMFVPLAVVRC